MHQLVLLSNFSYGVGGSANYGIGEANYSITQRVAVPTSGYQPVAPATTNNFYSGRWARCMNTSYDPSVTTSYSYLV